MSIKTAVGFLLSLISVLGINFIPFELLYYGDFSAQSAMVFYALENVLAMVFATVFVFLLAPRREDNHDYHRREELLKEKPAFPVVAVRTKKEILEVYLIVSGGLSLASIVFLAAFIFIIFKTSIQFSEIFTGLLWIVGFLIIEFLGDLLMLRPLTLVKTEMFLKRSMGRVALLFISIFIGIFLAAFVDRWFVIPFIVLKTIVDIGGLVQSFRPPKTNRYKL